MIDQPDRNSRGKKAVYPWHKKYKKINHYVLHRMCAKRVMVGSDALFNDTEKLNKLKMPQDVRGAWEGFLLGPYDNNGK